MADIVTPDGPVATTQGGTIYVKRYGDFSRFVPGGDCVYIGDITDELGGLNVTTRANAREGGLRRDGVLVDPPGTVSTTLSMKRLRGDKLKTHLKSCFWIFDKRTQCNDFDDPTGWQEIERVYRAKVGTRTTTPGTSIMDANAEDMVNFDITALEDVDLYRLHIESGTVEAAAPHTFMSVATCHSERCINCGDDETDAVFVAGSDQGAAFAYVYVNENNGDPGSWTAIVTTWAVGNVDAIACLGNWGLAISNGEAAAGSPVMYTRDRFVTQVLVDPAWSVTNPPLCLDAASQNYAFIGAENGFIYICRDGGVTWTESSGAEVTTDDIVGIRIAPSNRQIVYAWTSAAGGLVKTENGGETWFDITLAGALASAAILSLDVHPDDPNLVLVGTTAGQLFMTTDGGETFSEQAVLPGVTAKADVDIVDIKAAGGGVWFLAANEDPVGDLYSRVYINYEDGASGAWEYYNPQDGALYETLPIVKALAVAGQNRCVAVGGDGAAADMVALLS